jgi:hypothetical protein
MNEDPSPRFRRIQIVAKIFRFFCQLAMVLLVAGALMTIFNPDEMRGGLGDFRLERLKSSISGSNVRLPFFC